MVIIDKLVTEIARSMVWGLGFIFLSFSLKAQTAQQLENLAAFSRAYGYVKYFHPSDEAASMDWEKFAMYGSGQILKAENEDALLQSLRTLFEPIAPSVRFETGQASYDVNQLVPADTKGYKLTYWQHLGLGKDMGNPSGLYQSLRVDRMEIIDESDDFGNLLTSLEATPFLGKRIKLSGRAKMRKGSEGTGHFWLRVDLPDNASGFFNNMDENPIVENDWNTYEIIGTVDESAKHIVLGSFLVGKGEMWVDDLQLSYEEGGQWHPIPYVDGSFEHGSLEKDNPDNIWQIRGSGYSVEVISDDMLENNHLAKIQHVGIYRSKTPSALFKTMPSKGEIWSREIGSGISLLMPLVLYANDDHTFPPADDRLLQTLKHDLAQAAPVPTDLSFRLGNVINAWNVFQHFYPYFEEVKVDWKAAFLAAITESFEDKDEDDHEATLQRLTAKLRDGHVHVTQGMDNYFAPPITWEWIEDQLVITEVFDPELSIKVGDRVSHIDGVEAGDYFEEIYQRISSPTAGWRSYRANIVSILGPINGEMRLVVEGQEKLLKRDLFYYREVEQRRSLKEGYRLLDNDIVYLNLDVIPMDSIKALMPRLQQSRAIIADLRGYPKGNHELITHLLSQKDNKEWMHVPQIIYPDQHRLESYKSYGWSLKPQKPYLGDKKIVFITDGTAISYAESYMGFIEGYKLATIVGQPTAGTNGNINQFQLPGGYFITFTGMKVQKHDGSPLHGVGIQPDIYVEKTLKGLKEGRDEFLEKAIELAEGD